ncbi:MAG: hypothetical protein ACJARE_003488 [Paracoccaceae bacterium]
MLDAGGMGARTAQVQPRRQKLDASACWVSAVDPAHSALRQHPQQIVMRSHVAIAILRQRFDLHRKVGFSAGKRRSPPSKKWPRAWRAFRPDQASFMLADDIAALGPAPGQINPPGLGRQASLPQWHESWPAQ